MLTYSPVKKKCCCVFHFSTACPLCECLIFERDHVVLYFWKFAIRVTNLLRFFVECRISSEFLSEKLSLICTRNKLLSKSVWCLFLFKNQTF